MGEPGLPHSGHVLAMQWGWTGPSRPGAGRATKVWPVATLHHPVCRDCPGQGLRMETSQWDGIPGLWLEPQRRSLHSLGCRVGVQTCGACGLKLRGDLPELRVSTGKGRVTRWRERGREGDCLKNTFQQQTLAEDQLFKKLGKKTQKKQCKFPRLRNTCTRGGPADQCY